MTTQLVLKMGGPTTEISVPFLQGMADRMSVSFYKYGKVSDAYPLHVDAIDSMKERLRQYQRTGNTEFLIDAANFLMIEFMCPAHEHPVYEPGDSDKSPGRAVTHGSDRAATNEELKEKASWA